MQIIQFTCADEAVAGHLRRATVKQINTWSRLSLLASDPAYATEPFSPETVWRQKEDDTTTYWADWDSIYPHLGDDGRAVASFFVGTAASPGQLFKAPVHLDIMLEFHEVTDLVAAGYLPEAIWP